MRAEFSMYQTRIFIFSFSVYNRDGHLTMWYIYVSICYSTTCSCEAGVVVSGRDNYKLSLSVMAISLAVIFRDLRRREFPFTCE